MPGLFRRIPTSCLAVDSIIPEPICHLLSRYVRYIGQTDSTAEVTKQSVQGVSLFPAKAGHLRLQPVQQFFTAFRSQQTQRFVHPRLHIFVGFPITTFAGQLNQGGGERRQIFLPPYDLLVP